MDTIGNSLTFVGADGTIIPVAPASFGQTQDIISRYYNDQYENAEISLAGSAVALPLLSINLNQLAAPALKAAANVLKQITILTGTAYHVMSGGDAYQLATFMGPLIGHLESVHFDMVPELLSSSLATGDKARALHGVARRLENLAPTVNCLGVAAARWNCRSPQEAYQAALRSTSNAQMILIQSLIPGLSLDTAPVQP